MSPKRIAAGAAGVVLGLALLGGVADAQVGTNRSGGGRSNRPTTTTTTTAAPSTTVTIPDAVLGEEIEAPTSAPTVGGDVLAGGQEQAAAAQAEAPSGSLPITGGDVVGLAALGAAAVGGGALLIRRSRTAE